MDTNFLMDFIGQVGAHNDREWLHAHDEEYRRMKVEMVEITQTLLDGLSVFDPTLNGTEAKACIYRLQRDIRFSPDKSPYKNWLGSYMVAGGRSSMRAGYYLQIQPGGGSMLAGGIYCCNTPEMLKAIRNEIYDFGDDLVAVLNDPSFNTYFNLMDNETVKKLPSGFEPSPYDTYIKMKNWCIAHSFMDSEVRDQTTFIPRFIELAQQMKPFNDFFNRVLDESGIR